MKKSVSKVHPSADSTLRKLKIPPLPGTRVVLLFILLIGSGFWSYSKLQRVRDEYQGQVVEAVRVGEEDVSRKSASSGILKQAEFFQSWSVLILAGIIAISVTTKIHRTPGVSWIYLLLGPAVMFLLISLNTGWVLTKRHAYRSAKNNFTELGDLSALLDLQSDLFLYAVVCVSLFAAWFLFLIVHGKIEPFENSKGA
jgi:hypothetical protein